MTEAPAGFHDARKNRVSKFNWISIVGIPLAAILFQVVVPRFVPYLSYLELPLLVTVYFSLARRSAAAGVLFGMGIGLAQDSLSPPLPQHPLGLFGIAKTLVGYFAGTISQRFDVETSGVRLLLALFFFSSTSSSIGSCEPRCWAITSISNRCRPSCWRCSTPWSRFLCFMCWIN